MTEPPIHGHTKSGRPITDHYIESLPAEAEAGYDVETLIARATSVAGPRSGTPPPASSQSDWTVNSAANSKRPDEHDTPGWRIARHVSHAR
jgi:hypothetical protein